MPRRTRNKRKSPTRRKLIDIGEKFGRLTVEDIGDSYVWKGRKSHRRLICVCTCGSYCEVRSYQLRSGHTKSCGCLRRELAAKNKYRHGSRARDGITRDYILWRDLRARYPDSITRRWCADRGKGFLYFLRDVGPRPSDGHRLVRLDPKKKWSRANCEWSVSPKRTGTPRRWLQLGGRTVTLREAAEISGVKYDTLWARLKRGWPLKRAIEP